MYIQIPETNCEQNAADTTEIGKFATTLPALAMALPVIPKSLLSVVDLQFCTYSHACLTLNCWYTTVKWNPCVSLLNLVRVADVWVHTRSVVKQLQALHNFLSQLSRTRTSSKRHRCKSLVLFNHIPTDTLYAKIIHLMFS